MSFTENEILGIMLIGTILILGVIFFFRRKFAAQTEELVDKYHSDALSASVKKYPEADAFKFKNTFLKFGLVCSLGVAILAFSWTVFEEQYDTTGFVQLEDFTETEDIPIVPPDQKPPPPPPPPVIDDVDDQEIDEDITFEDFSMNDDDLIDYEPYEKDEDKNDNQPFIVEEEEEEPDFDIPFVRVEKMPSFPGCNDLGTEEERKKCTEQNLLKYIYKNIKYPSVAKENQIEGLVVIQFVVDKNGSISGTKILKDIGGGCGEEVVRVLKTMNSQPQKWSAGEQRGRKVKVSYNIPIRFELRN